MDINSIILEELSEKTKKRLKKLAVASGAALAAGAGIQHLRNLDTKYQKDQIFKRHAPWMLTDIAQANLENAVKDRSLKSSAIHTGIAAAKSAGRHIGYELLGRAAARVIHGKDTFFNQQKKHNTASLIDFGLGAADLVKTGHDLYKTYKQPSQPK